MQDLTPLLTLRVPPPLDAAWLAHEEVAGLSAAAVPASSSSSTPSSGGRRSAYAAACRARNAAMLAPGARDHALLARGVRVRRLAVAGSSFCRVPPPFHSQAEEDDDEYAVPVLRYELGDAGGGEEGGKEEEEGRDGAPEKEEAVAGGDEREDEDEEPAGVVILYIHGGGLLVGEADSEELTCRRLVKCCPPASRTRPRTVLYSVGYRLMPAVPARTCVADVLSVLGAVRARHPAAAGARLLVVGSSSGGELAALATQAAALGTVQGVLLRCPVTVDAPGLVPAPFRAWHFSASPAPSGSSVSSLPSSSSSYPFATSLLGPFHRSEPRDGLDRMPLECPPDDLRALRLPRTWIQVCTNDVLYSDGMCYAKLLQDAGVEVKVDVVSGWPHTFWLKAPHLDRALAAEEELLRGLAWVLGTS